MTELELKKPVPESTVSIPHADVASMPATTVRSSRGVIERFFTTNFECEMHELLSDPDFIAIQNCKERSSVFSILGRTHTELWHSNFISWLLNPESEHGLGYFPIRRLLSSMRKKAKANNFDNILNLLPSQDLIDTGSFEDCRIQPDCHKESEGLAKERSFFHDNNKCNLDIAFTCTIRPWGNDDKCRLLFICENKITAKENPDQTEKYAKWADKGDCFPLYTMDGQKPRRIDWWKTQAHHARLFLTCDNSTPKNASFLHMTYAELMDDVLMPSMKNSALSDIGRLLLKEYIHTLDRSGIAFSENLKINADNIQKKYAMVFFSLLKILLFNDLFGEGGAYEKDIDFRLDWLARFNDGFGNIKVKRVTGYCDATVAAGKTLGKPIVKGASKYRTADITVCAGDEECNNGKKLDEYWGIYKKSIYLKRHKDIYAKNIGEKYHETLHLLFEYLKKYMPEDYTVGNWGLVKKHFVVIGDAYFNSESRTSYDWSSFASDIYHYVNDSDNFEEIPPQCDGEETERYYEVEAYMDYKDENGNKKTARAIVKLMKRPKFYPVKDDPEPKIDAAGESGTAAMRHYDNTITLPWSSLWYVKHSEKKEKTQKFADFAQRNQKK